MNRGGRTPIGLKGKEERQLFAKTKFQKDTKSASKCGNSGWNQLPQWRSRISIILDPLKMSKCPRCVIFPYLHLHMSWENSRPNGQTCAFATPLPSPPQPPMTPKNHDLSSHMVQKITTRSRSWSRYRLLGDIVIGTVISSIACYPSIDTWFSSFFFHFLSLWWIPCWQCLRMMCVTPLKWPQYCTVFTLGPQNYNDIPIPSTIWVDVTHQQKSYGIQLQSWRSLFMKSLDDHVCE